MSERGSVQFGDTVIEYTVQRSRRRRKTVAITLDSVEGVLVSAPMAASCEKIRELVGKRAGWIIRRWPSAQESPPAKDYVTGESLPYLGRRVRLAVREEAIRQVIVRFTHWRFEIMVPRGLAGEERRAAIRRGVTRWYRARALERLGERAAWWAAQAGYAPTGVLVRDQRQRWGSCAPDGTLRFNWRIVLAPPSLVDYVVVHELAHLRERNHGPGFWAEVGRHLPDYGLRRAQLKELGPQLTI